MVACGGAAVRIEGTAEQSNQAQWFRCVYPADRRACKGNTSMYHPAHRWFGCLAGLIMALAVHSTCRAGLIEIHGDRLSVQAVRTPLHELMQQLSINFGITVRMDPEINPLITMTFKNRELEEGLQALLKPQNHVLIWKSAAAEDSSPRYALSEIHIFKPGQKERMVDIEQSAEKEAADTQAEPEATPPAGTDAVPETPVIIKDNKVFVPVVLGYENYEARTTLVFDTGAGSILLHENVARQLGIEETRNSQGEGVGGIVIATRTARLDYVRVGPYEKKNLRADIVAYTDNGEEYNGLLGMNFIRGLKYTIDFDSQVIKWNP